MIQIRQRILPSCLNPHVRSLQALDFVAQICGALEFELLRRFFHLGGEVGDELLLFGRRQLALLARDAVELGLGGILGFLFADFDEVTDAFLYRLRRDTVFAVVRRLNLAAAVGLVDRRPHR